MFLLFWRHRDVSRVSEKLDSELLWKLVKNVGDNLQSGVLLGRWHREGVGCRKH